MSNDQALERRIKFAGHLLLLAMLYQGDTPTTRELQRQHLELIAKRSPQRLAQMHATVMRSR